VLPSPWQFCRRRHLSSTATCIESLLSCPSIFRPKKGKDILNLAQRFALSAIERGHGKWLSDGSAPIYCRCRTLPLVVNHLPRYRTRIQQHLERILRQLNVDDSRFAIGEASGDRQSDWYPPNVFHTYWTLYLLHTVETRFPDAFADLSASFKGTRLNLGRVRHEMLTWAKHFRGRNLNKGSK
jgi:hypothetical protein